MARYNRFKKLPIQADAGIYVGVDPIEIADGSGIVGESLNPSSVTNTAIADGAITSAKLDQGLLKLATVSLTAAQINGMYATPVVVVPAVAGKEIYVQSVEFDVVGTATQFTGGGVVNVQYDSTANGAGTTVHADIAATVVTNATSEVHTYRIPKDLSAIATASIQGKGLYISNKTAAFATGTGTATVIVRYFVS